MINVVDFTGEQSGSLSPSLQVSPALRDNEIYFFSKGVLLVDRKFSICRQSRKEAGVETLIHPLKPLSQKV